MLNVIIVGAGPAGLSSALILGRSRRSVLIFDSGQTRNQSSTAMHGFLTRENIPPSDFLKIAREQLKPYTSVQYKADTIVDATRGHDQFSVTTRGKETYFAKKLVLATGLQDEIPEIPGIQTFFGKSVFLCPYCDGWETRDAPIAVYGREEKAANFALTMSLWSRDIIVCAEEPIDLESACCKKLKSMNIEIIQKPIAALEGQEGHLNRILFKDGTSISRKFLFFNTGKNQRTKLAEKLGCRVTANGDIETNDKEGTPISGLYVVGDASKDVKLAIIAAAEGAKAAVAINSELLNEELAG